MSNTIRIKGSCQNKNLIILIDSCSTHSFIDEHVVKEIKTAIKRTIVLVETIANNNVLRCNVLCLKFIWLMQGHKFHMDMRVLKLGRCDTVLGVDWLITHQS